MQWRHGQAGWIAAATIAAACGGSVEGGEERDPDAGVVPIRDDGGRPSRPTCGNGRAEADEACDGADLNGATCGSVTMGVRGGPYLRCTSTCAFDTSGCQTFDYAGGRPNVGGSGGMSTGGASPGGGGNVGGSAGSSIGDPHIFTADGLEYDFQAVGEFILLEDEQDPSFVVQVRQVPFRSFTMLSSNGAVAALVAGDRVALYAGDPPTVRVEGVDVDVERSLRLPHGGELTEDGETFTVSWPSGEAIVVNATWSALLNVTYRPAAAGKARALRGLLGRPDGDPHNDLTTRRGEALLCSGCADQIYDVFGASFRIADAESLFDYERGQTTRDFTDLAFPHGPREALALPPETLRIAYLTCVTEGVTDVAALEACTTDVALTGDAGFARAAAAQR